MKTLVACAPGHVLFLDGVTVSNRHEAVHLPPHEGSGRGEATQRIAGALQGPMVPPGASLCLRSRSARASLLTGPRVSVTACRRSAASQAPENPFPSNTGRASSPESNRAPQRLSHPVGVFTRPGGLS